MHYMGTNLWSQQFGDPDDVAASPVDITFAQSSCFTNVQLSSHFAKEEWMESNHDDYCFMTFGL